MADEELAPFFGSRANKTPKTPQMSASWALRHFNLFLNILLNNSLLPSATLTHFSEIWVAFCHRHQLAELCTFVTFVLLLTSALHHIQKLGEANPFVPIIVGFLDELSTLMSSDNLNHTVRNQIQERKSESASSFKMCHWETGTLPLVMLVSVAVPSLVT